jgi:hypothetical protein
LRHTITEIEIGKEKNRVEEKLDKKNSREYFAPGA